MMWHVEEYASAKMLEYIDIKIFLRYPDDFCEGVLFLGSMWFDVYCCIKYVYYYQLIVRLIMIRSKK